MTFRTTYKIQHLIYTNIANHEKRRRDLIIENIIFTVVALVMIIAICLIT